MNKLNIAYVGEFRFPRGDAASSRVYNVGRLLKKAGHNVIFIGKIFYNSKNDNILKGNYDGFNFINIGKEKSSILRRAFVYLFGGIFILNKISKIKLDVIILYGGYSRYIIPLLIYSKRYHIKLVIDVVEWYRYRDLPFGRYGPITWDVHLALTKLIPYSDGIIVISTYLEAYYKKTNKNIVRIPIIYNSEDLKWNSTDLIQYDNSFLNLIYCGIPSKKDLIAPIIEGISILNPIGYKIKIHFIGITLTELNKYISAKQYYLIKNNICCYGWIDQDDIPKYIARCDFFIFTRENDRSSNAGFPTKLIESLASGTPIITNLTSDLNMFLSDGKDSLIMKNWTKEEVASSIKRALLLSLAEKAIMKQNARVTAYKYFNYINYVGKVEEFISNLTSS